MKGPGILLSSATAAALHGLSSAESISLPTRLQSLTENDILRRLGLLRRPSAAQVRHDPRREKTPEDLAAIAAAEAKRAKRAAKKAQA